MKFWVPVGTRETRRVATKETTTRIAITIHV